MVTPAAQHSSCLNALGLHNPVLPRDLTPASVPLSPLHNSQLGDEAFLTRRGADPKSRVGTSGSHPERSYPTGTGLHGLEVEADTPRAPPAPLNGKG